MKVTNDIIYVGVNDHQTDLFEGQYAVPNGMAYNSYVIRDEKVAVLMVSHDIGNIVTQANKILQLKQTVQFYGTVEEYKKSEFGREFLVGES